MKKKNIIRWALIGGFLFLSGFLMGAKQLESNWVGYLVSGKETPKSVNSGILIPGPDPFTPTVASDIVIGLREDGVVVWKKK